MVKTPDCERSLYTHPIVYVPFASITVGNTLESDCVGMLGLFAEQNLLLTLLTQPS